MSLRLPDRLPARRDEPEASRLQMGRPALAKGDDSYAITDSVPMSARVGSRALWHLRRRLSERDIAIVTAVGQHRYLAARQIEQLLFYLHASDTTATRICRRVLQRLTDDRVLSRLERRIGGVAAGSAAYIYTLGPVGHRLLDEGRTRRRRHEPSPAFLVHTLTIADTRIALERAERSSTLKLTTIEMEPSCWRSFHGSGGGLERLRPDLYIATSSAEFDDFWFLEIDLSTESLPAIVRKCRAYQLYRRTGREQDRSDVFPIVVWVAPDERRASKIRRAISSAKDLPPELFRVTTNTGLVELIAGGPA